MESSVHHANGNGHAVGVSDKALAQLLEKTSIDPLTDQMFIQHYPNLVEWQDQLSKPPSIIRGERERLNRFFFQLARERTKVRQTITDPDLQTDALRDVSHRFLFEYYRKTYRLAPDSFEVERDRLFSCVREARASVERLIDRYIPEVDRLQIDMSSDVEREDDPIGLLRLCGEGGSDSLAMRTRAEARRQLTIAMLLYEMHRGGSAYDDLERDMTDFDNELKHRSFVRGRSTRLLFSADLDPAADNRVSHLAIAPMGAGEFPPSTSSARLIGRIEPRFLNVGGKDVPVVYETRVKEDPWIKLIQKNERDPRVLRDMCGVRFIFFELEDVELGVKHLRDRIVCVPGTVFGQVSNLARSGAIDAKNIHSAEEFRAWKFNVKIFDRFFEIQFMLFKDWLNERCSRGPENHTNYKLRRMLADVFPKLFPYVDWNDVGLRRRMYAMQLGKIGHII